MYNFIHNSTEYEIEQDVRNVIELDPCLTLTINRDTGEFVLTDPSTHRQQVVLNNTTIGGSSFWKNPSGSVMYFRNINFVVVMTNPAHLLLYWGAKVFGVGLTIPKGKSSSSRSEYFRFFRERAEEFAEMGIIPYKLVKLIQEF